LIKTLNHFSPNEVRIALFFACDRGAGIPRNANNFDKHQSAPAPIFHRKIDLPTFLLVQKKNVCAAEPDPHG